LPGTQHGYHGQSLGWYESEIVSRVDPQRRRIGRFFADEVAAPLGVDFHLGLPTDIDRGRIAHIHGFRTWEMPPHLSAMPAPFVLAFANPRSLTARAFGNPKILGVPENFNRPDVQAAEIQRPTVSVRCGRLRSCTARRPPAARFSASPRPRWKL